MNIDTFWCERTMLLAGAVVLFYYNKIFLLFIDLFILLSGIIHFYTKFTNI